MRLVFMGSGAFGLPTLEQLTDQHEWVMVVSQPDRPAGRKRRMTPTPISTWALAHDLPLIRTDNVNDPAVVEQLRGVGADANVVIAFGQKISRAVIGLPRLESINLHASLLPKYRGAGPIQHAMIQGERETGLSVITLADVMDAGEVLGQVATPISPTETAGELHDRLAAMGPGLMGQVLDALAAGTAVYRAQDESQASYAPKLSRADAVVDLQRSGREVAARINGLSPWPGVRLSIRRADGTGDAIRLIVRRVEPMNDCSCTEPAGHLLAEKGVLVTGHGAVCLLAVQPPGRRTMLWPAFARGQDLAGVMLAECEA